MQQRTALGLNVAPEPPDPPAGAMPESPPEKPAGSLPYATTADLDACIMHFAARSADGKIGRFELRTSAAVAWVANNRRALTKQVALLNRLADATHDEIRRRQGKAKARELKRG
jgi:hypothetical protein